MLNQLKSFNAEAGSLEDAVALSAFARSFQEEFEKVGAEVPEWLPSKVKEIRREIRNRQQDAIEKALSDKKSRLLALQPAEERRKALQDEIERLEALAAK